MTVADDHRDMLRLRRPPATSPAELARALSSSAVLIHPPHIYQNTSEPPHAVVVSWTSLVSGAVRSGALHHFTNMATAGLPPNEFALSSALSACAGLADAGNGGGLHSLAVKSALESNRFVGGALVHMCAQCGRVDAARRLFDQLRESGSADVACWNMMVGAYARDGQGREGIGMVKLMKRLGLVFDAFTFVEALMACSLVEEDVRVGKMIHGLVVKGGFDCFHLVFNSLITMYFKYRFKVSALQVFDELRQKDVVSWNAVISGLARYENVEEAVECFCGMMESGLRPNRVSLSTLIRMCGDVDELCVGVQVFAVALRLGLACDAMVGGALVGMFSRCGDIESARILFDGVVDRSVICWNEMIYGYALNGFCSESFELFCMLRRSEIAANEVTYSNFLVARNGVEHGDMSRQIHCCAIKLGYDSNGYVGSALINAYAKAGEVLSLKKIFQSIKVLDAPTWGSMISALSHVGCFGEAIVTSNCLLMSGKKADMLSSLLSVCAATSTAYNQTKCIHSYVIKSASENYPCVASSIIDAYAKCGDISSSKKTFDSILSCKDPILFNSMITSYAQHGFLMEVIDLIEKMEPNNVTFVSVISACGHLGLVDQGRKFFDSMSSRYGMLPSEKNYACLIDMYARSGFLSEAQEVIAEMPFEPWPAVYRSLLNGCRIHGNSELAKLAAQNLLRLEPKNDAAHLLLMNTYAENEKWEDVSVVKALMRQKEVRKETSYSRIDV